MRKVLRESFFNRDTKVVAKELLGKFLVRKITNKEISAMITEAEAYNGPHDLASHASKGRTVRTEIMFGNPGRFYVYLCYGMHYMLNVVTREHGYPAAVLIRGVKSGKININGPGKVTKLLKINRSLNGKRATRFRQGLDMAKEKSANLWFEDRGITISKIKIKKLPRIGVEYAGHIWSSKKLRFLLKI